MDLNFQSCLLLSSTTEVGARHEKLLALALKQKVSPWPVVAVDEFTIPNFQVPSNPGGTAARWERVSAKDSETLSTMTRGTSCFSCTDCESLSA